MEQREELDELIRGTYERRAQSLLPVLDARMEPVLRARASRTMARVLKPALALTSLTLSFAAAWIYDLHLTVQDLAQYGPVVRDPGYERPRVVLEQAGDPELLARQAAGLAAPTSDRAIGSLRKSLSEDRVSPSAGPMPFARESAGALSPHLYFTQIQGRVLRTSAQGNEEVFVDGLNFPAYVLVSESGDVFVADRRNETETVVYRISPKRFSWWKFYCLYRC